MPWFATHKMPLVATLEEENTREKKSLAWLSQSPSQSNRQCHMHSWRLCLEWVIRETFQRICTECPFKRTWKQPLTALPVSFPCHRWVPFTGSEGPACISARGTAAPLLQGPLSEHRHDTGWGKSSHLGQQRAGVCYVGSLI